jgi:carbamoyl-phosphate synthase large subunit
VHSGDSACSLPPFSLPPETVEAVKAQARALAKELGVRGLMNVQFAVPRDGRGIFILEVNPRASRTVPFVSKVTGVPLAKIAARIAVGKTLKEMKVKEVTPTHVAVKEAVFPFLKFAGVDTILGPEMRSTGEVMGIDKTFAAAFGKSQIGAGTKLPLSGRVFLSLQNSDKPGSVVVAQGLRTLGYQLVATGGTQEFLTKAGIEVERVNKVREGRPHIVDRILDGDIQVVVNTTAGAQAIKDSFPIRRTALMRGVPYYTTLSAARAAVAALGELRAGRMGVRSLQEYQNG